jgi:HAMP domain-containing protein
MNAKSIMRTVSVGAAIAFLIVTCAGVIGLWQYRVLNQQTATQILDTAQAVHKYIFDQRVAHLEEVSKTIAENPSFVSYISQALATVDAGNPTADVASIRDLLEDRRHTYNLDAAVILDAAGKQIVNVGDTMFAARESAALPIVALVKQNPAQASRIIGDDKRVFLVTATPLMRGTDIEALLLTGARFDDPVIKNMARVSQSDLALLTNGPTGQHLIATTLGTQDVQPLTTLLAARREQGLDADASGLGSHTFEFEIDGHAWSARLAPLDHALDKISLMVLVPPTRRATIYMALAPPLIIGTLTAIALVAIALFLIWRSVVRPLTALDAFATRAISGDHALEIKPAGIGMTARIGSAFNHLLRDLDRHRVAPGAPRRRATDRK